MKICPACNYENPDTNKFCNYCGAQLSGVDADEILEGVVLAGIAAFGFRGVGGGGDFGARGNGGVCERHEFVAESLGVQPLHRQMDGENQIAVEEPQRGAVRPLAVVGKGKRLLAHRFRQRHSGVRVGDRRENDYIVLSLAILDRDDDSFGLKKTALPLVRNEPESSL